MQVGDNKSLSQRPDTTGSRCIPSILANGIWKIGTGPASNVCPLPPAMNTRTENASLKGAEFDNVDLGHARFRDVNLAGARFHDVSFAGAGFEDVSLSGATISDANCSGLSIENACYERMTIDGIPVTELLRVYHEFQAEGSDGPITTP
jgi:hypothetical protein